MANSERSIARHPLRDSTDLFSGDGYPTKTLPDGRTAVVMPLTFGRARLSVGQKHSMGFDDQW